MSGGWVVTESGDVTPGSAVSVLDVRARTNLWRLGLTQSGYVPQVVLYGSLVKELGPTYTITNAWTTAGATSVRTPTGLLTRPVVRGRMVLVLQ